MPLIIEDGSIVSGAQSYAPETDLLMFATARGIDLTNLSVVQREVLLIKAMDYLEGLRDLYKGLKTISTQSLQWPRRDVWIDSSLLGQNTIPRELEYAQLQLAIEANTNDLSPTRLPSDKGEVIKERVEGAIEVAYANQKTRRSIPAFAKADALLAPLLRNNGLIAVRT